MRTPALADAADVARAAGEMLATLGVADRCSAVPMKGGANNRVFRIEAGSRRYLLKSYFDDPADRRDRFRAERAFYEHALACGTSRVPIPLAWDEARRLGLLEFVEGAPVAPKAIDRQHVAEAAAFIQELNPQTPPPSVEAVPIASEACFSLREHLECVGQRVERLRGIAGDTEIDRAARHFVARDLAPTWDEVRADIEAGALAAGLSVSKALAPVERCISPSDFGFHNALIGGDGHLRFFDFEYAGRDDPAKGICDFFCQPRIPIPLAFWEEVVRAFGSAVADRRLAARSRILLPAYQIKWSCIRLNEFLEDGVRRRRFATADLDVDAAKRSRLIAARDALAVCRAGLSSRSAHAP
jgi:hypothetical protein